MGELPNEDENDSGREPERASEPLSDGGNSGGSNPPDTTSADENPDENPDELLDALVNEAAQYESPKISQLQEIIRKAITLRLTPTYIACLIQHLHKYTGLAVPVLHQMYLDCLNTDPEHGVLHTAPLATDALLAKLRERYVALVWCAGELWHYPHGGEDGHPQGGYFGHSSPEEIEKFLLEECGRLPSLATKAKRTEVIQRLASMLLDATFFDDAPGGSNVRNGFLQYDAATRTVKLFPPGPQYKARARIMVDYDPEARSPNFDAGLALTFGDPDNAKALAEFLGCALLGVTPGLDNARHVLVLVGPRQGGKSTTLEIFRLLVPSYAVAAVSPTEWSTDYKRAMLRGIILNIVSELGAEGLVAGAVFKAIASHEEVTARLPYMPAFKFRPVAWHIFACNTVMKTNDKDPAFERRVLGIRLDRSLLPSEIDPDFLNKVSLELPGVLNWAVAAAVEAMRRGHFTLPAGHTRVVAEMQYGGDLYARFVFERMEKAPVIGPSVSTVAINAALKRYAEQDGIDTANWKPTTGARRIAELLRALYGAIQHQVTGVPNYRGVRLKVVP